MKGNHIIQAVNFNNGEALDLQSLNGLIKSDIIENSELSDILGGGCELFVQCDKVTWCRKDCGIYCHDCPARAGD